MSVQELPDTPQAYELGSLAVAILYQTWAWKTELVPGAVSVSSRRIQPVGPVTVGELPSTSIVASRRSPAVTPAGAATLVPSVTLDLERKLGGAAVVEKE